MREKPSDLKRAKGFGSSADLAKLLGVSQASIKEAIDVGRIERDTSGWLHLQTAAAAFRNSSVGPANGNGGAGQDDDDDGTGGETFAKARTRKEIANADLAEAKAAETQRELVAVVDVERLWFNATRSIRSRLLALPQVLAGRMVGMSSAQIRTTLDSEIRAALLDLPESPPSEQ